MKASGVCDRDAPEVRSSPTRAGAALSAGDCKGKCAAVHTAIWGFVIAVSCVQPIKSLLCLDETSVEFAQVSLVRVLILDSSFSATLNTRVGSHVFALHM